ncbi:uncharacterized protein LACBIDRAFT_318336 [Laccaria bicolor S238N-H82]|uniref:General transcription and DNA repair factor IIH subunit TFB5 n=1 Tax=Laccaria bicolor (strain S238N-H82 / ATCC MYA-4686) TaxID=486041 RepID=B0D6I1_LACBS|nr:uncharacterized protein LACBIDRAFT_318336 [Laccaria bicolor S238N-H82]EDR10191.1 predicted protein [Laccaria bicolor S238N-H82]|eukprot:XP_001879576.1 predicted protein [Laccaria bicolor S238N-H82]
MAFYWRDNGGGSCGEMCGYVGLPAFRNLPDKPSFCSLILTTTTQQVTTRLDESYQRDPVHLVCDRLHGQLRLLSLKNNSSDPAVKQILLSMNEKSSFIIEDLDDHHLVIKADEEYRVRKELETELEKNTYSMET